MENIRTKLIEYFGRNKGILNMPYKEVKAEILSLSDEELMVSYKVHVEELKFYSLI